MTTGRFIVFEGGDGAGKSTAAKTLVAMLQDASEDVVLTREPGGTPRAEEIRSLLLQRKPEDRFDRDAQTALFYAARIEHVKHLIIPALQAGKTVVCDRFELSTYQYQITAGEARSSLLQSLHTEVSKLLRDAGVSLPEYVVFVIDPETGLARVRQAKHDAGDDTPDVFDDADIEFHRKLQAGVQPGLTALGVSQYHFIDAGQSPEAVLAEVKKKIQL